MSKRHRIRPDRTERARLLRQDAPFPERLLWSRLRAGCLDGLKFRRQHTVGPFVVDFYCAAASLVVELDGVTHEGREPRDAARTAYLESQGLRVVRYTNDEVLADVNAVVLSIAEEAGVDW